MMELVCRSFLCDIGDDYKEIAMKLNKVDEEKYNEVRNTELAIAQALIQQIKKDFKEDPEFDEMLEKFELLD
jgi:arginyl-tRNA synthetase